MQRTGRGKKKKAKGRKPELLYSSFGTEILGEMCNRKRKQVICIQLIEVGTLEKVPKQVRWLEICGAEFYNKKDVNHSHGRVIRKAKEAEKSHVRLTYQLD